MSHSRQRGGRQRPYEQPPQSEYQQPQYGYPPQNGYAPPQAGYPAPADYPPQQGYPPGYYQQQPSPQPRKRKRRVFLWMFLAIQVLFAIWLITGLATVNTAASASQVAAACDHHAWYPLFTSQADCVKHYGGALTDAGDAGKAIGAGLIVVFWMVVDVILGISYGVYKLATRGR